MGFRIEPFARGTRSDVEEQARELDSLFVDDLPRARVDQAEAPEVFEDRELPVARGQVLRVPNARKDLPALRDRPEDALRAQMRLNVLQLDFACGVRRHTVRLPEVVIDRGDIGFPEEMHVGDVPDLLAFVHQAIGRARAAADQDLVEWLVQERVDVAREEPVEGVVEGVEGNIGFLVPTAPDAADALPGREDAVGKPGEDANGEPPDVHHDSQGVGAEDGLVASGAESVLPTPRVSCRVYEVGSTLFLYGFVISNILA